MTGAERDWAEAERMWRRTEGTEDRFDLIERALAAIAGRRAGQEFDEASNDGRKE